MTFKQKLARIFDDNLETLQWKNVFDYTIISLIVLSVVEVFLSTFDSVVAEYGGILHWIDVLTTAMFTVEVTLRIWCADLLDDKYKGLMGRVRYCLSFYGLLDFLATYTFYLGLFLPLNFTVFKSLRLVRVLRVFRLLRVFRYMKSARLMAKAVKRCKTEMIISMQLLVITTIILSFVLFFVEHEVQPDVYCNGWMSVAWAFAQYVGDPGGFADTPPITVLGQVIAFIVGILGVAIFAVPAGIIGGAFSDVMNEEQHEEQVKENVKKLHRAFLRKLDRPTGFQICPRYIPIVTLQAKLGVKEDDILEAAADDDHFRIINLATTQPANQHPTDRLAIEHFPTNTSYGLCIDRGSKITIFAPSNVVDAITGWWAYYLAKIGGFNFISKELGARLPFGSFFTYDANKLNEHQQEFMDDMNLLADDENKWIFCVMAASGAEEPEFPTQFHFEYGGKKGDETYDDPNIMLNDIPLFDAFYKASAQMLEEKYGLLSDRQRYHNTNNPKIFARHLEHKVNTVILRVAWSVTCWDMRAIAIAKDFADQINAIIEPEVKKELSPELKVKDMGYDGYIDENITHRL